MEKIRVGIVGASGYTGQELVRAFLGHKYVDLVHITSSKKRGKSIAEVFPEFSHHKKARELKFEVPNVERILSLSLDSIFLALPHGNPEGYVPHLLEKIPTIFDLSADFRLNNPELYKKYYGFTHSRPDLLNKSVYGLTEIYLDKLKNAKLIACPGCYPTSILLPLIPLMKRGLIEPSSICISSTSGTSGAGKSPKENLIYSEMTENFAGYSSFAHRHNPEIEQELSKAQKGQVKISFAPCIAPIKRGMYSTIFFSKNEGITENDIEETYQLYYKDSPFIRLLGKNKFPEIKHVSLSNFCDISWHISKDSNKAILFSAIDNIGKGSSFGAIHSFNIRYGIPETEGIIFY